MAETILLATHKRLNIADLCFGRGLEHAPDSGLMLGEAIAANSSRTVLCKPLLDIWSMNKAYPLWAAPLQFMFTLADAVQAFQETVNGVDRSQSFVVEAHQMLCSTMEVDASLLEIDRKHILSGGELTFELSSWINIRSAVTSPSCVLALNRSLHMCHGLYATFMPAAGVNTRMASTCLAPTGYDVPVYIQVGRKKLGRPFKCMAALLYRLHEGVWGAQHGCPHSEQEHGSIQRESVIDADCSTDIPGSNIVRQEPRRPKCGAARRELEQRCCSCTMLHLAVPPGHVQGGPRWREGVQLIMHLAFVKL